MTVALASLPFLLAAICAALMGYAIQRGATCTVAAVGEIVREGTANRLIALAEAAVWVAGGLLVALALGLLTALPTGYALTGWTVLGGAMLGIGAFTNRACVFGSIAKLGSGNWTYALTPLGFYLGALTAPSLSGAMMPRPLPSLAMVSHFPPWIAPIFAVYVIWRVVALVRRPQDGTRGLCKVWRPHEATILIGVTFTIMLVAVGAWSYTDLLTRLAGGMADGEVWRLVLLLALLVGAVLGGWTAGLLEWRKLQLVWLARCLAGGTLMGWGSVLIPGSNDGLILVGMPLLWPYAWVSILTMCITIWIALIVERALSASR